MTPDETQIRIFADWPMSHAKHVTKDNRKNSEYHVAVAIRRMGTDKICPAEKSCPDDVEKDNYFQIYSKILYHDWFSACPFFA